LNRRPSGYEPDELPDCSIPRLCGGILQRIAELSSDRRKKMLFLQAVSRKGGLKPRRGLLYASFSDAHQTTGRHLL
jgi:hypothetical protein